MVKKSLQTKRVYARFNAVSYSFYSMNVNREQLKVCFLNLQSICQKYAY